MKKLVAVIVLTLAALFGVSAVASAGGGECPSGYVEIMGPGNMVLCVDWRSVG